MLDNKPKSTKATTVYPYSIRVISKDMFLIDGRVWYTHDSYIRELRFSESSTQLPYSHVRAYKAEFLDICGLKLFSPVLKGGIQ